MNFQRKSVLWENADWAVTRRGLEAKRSVNHYWISAAGLLDPYLVDDMHGKTWVRRATFDEALRKAIELLHGR